MSAVPGLTGATCATCPWLTEPAYLVAEAALNYPGAKQCSFQMPGHRCGPVIPSPEAYGCSMHPKAQAWAALAADRMAPDALPTFDPLEPPADPRPSGCTMRLRAEGKAAPRSGCASCGNGGMMGCPHERKAQV